MKKLLFVFLAATVMFACSKEEESPAETTPDAAAVVESGEEPITLQCYNPKPRPWTVCPDVIDPVCACGVITFNNRCEAERMGFRNTQPGPCISVSKPDVSCRVEAVAAAMRKMGAQCAAVWQPVCGCDGRTYSNYCYAIGNGVLVWTPGECNKVPEPPFDPGTIIDVNTP